MFLFNCRIYFNNNMMIGQIKPRNDTDQLKIQTSKNIAFFVHGSGATLKNSTIENTNTFPTGKCFESFG